MTSKAVKDAVLAWTRYPSDAGLRQIQQAIGDYFEAKGLPREKTN
jgi:hypothetical protein